MVSTVAQIIGIVLLAFGVWLLWSPWALVAAGGVLLVVPEIAAQRRRR